MDDQNLNLSVLMSTYHNDNPRFLKKALNSLCTQTLRAREVVLVEDGPITAALRAVIDEFRQPLNIKSVRLEVNAGLGNALALGLKNCSAPLVARMDTDDIAVPQRFEKQYKFLINNKNIAVLGSHISEFSHDPDSPTHNRTTKLTHSEIVRAAWLRNPLNHMTVMFRKDAIIKAGNYRDVRSFEDYDLWIRVIAAGYQCHNLDEVLVYARTGNGLFERRSGWKYITAEFNAVLGFHKYGVIPKSALMLNLATRLSIRIMPKNLIKLAYSTLRAKPDCENYSSAAPCTTEHAAAPRASFQAVAHRKLRHD